MPFSPRPLRVCLIAADPAVHTDMAGRLRRLGCEVMAAPAGTGAAVDRGPAAQVVLMHGTAAQAKRKPAAAALPPGLAEVPVVVFSDAPSVSPPVCALHPSDTFFLAAPFTDRELCTTLALAHHHHQTEQRLHTALSQVQATSLRVLQAQEQERRRVAIELHDELGQSLTALKINLQMGLRTSGEAAQELTQDSLGIVEETLQQVRNLATALRPSVLDDLGLAPALRWLAEQVAGRSGFSASVFFERGQPRLHTDIETACFRIAQEALTNISRHAQARSVAIRLTRQGQRLRLVVQDDGQGFDVAAVHARASAGASLGVLGMQERATLIGGQLHIESEPGRGCVLTLSAPWRSAPAVP